MNSLRVYLLVLVAVVLGLGTVSAQMASLQVIHNAADPAADSVDVQFNPSTDISFSVPQSELVRIKVFNSLGQEVATLVNGQMEAGSYKVTFDARKLASGVYLYRMEAGQFSAVQRMVLVKEASGNAAFALVR